MLAVDPINAVVAGVPQSLARSGNAAENVVAIQSARLMPPEGGGSSDSFGGGR